MSHFYGTLQGARGRATRCGHTALTTEAAGWRGCIRVELEERDGADHFVVILAPWERSGGTARILAEGVLDAEVPRHAVP